MSSFLELKCAQCGAEGIVKVEDVQEQGTGFRFEGILTSDDICEHAEEPDAQFYVRITNFDDEED